MMGPRFLLFARLSIANLRRHRVRWLSTSVGVALGVAAFTGALAISRSISHAFEQSVLRTAGAAQLQVSNGSAGVDTTLIDEIAAVPGVAVASGTVQFNVGLPAAAGQRLTIFGILLGRDDAYREAQFGRDALTLPDSLRFLANVDSIALSTDFLAAQGLKIGSSIDVVGPKGLTKLTVRGWVRAEGAMRIFGDNVAIMDADAAQHAFGELDRFHWLDVVAKPDVDIEQLRAQLDRVVGGRGVVETPRGRGRKMEAMLATLRWMLTFSSIVALMVGVFLIQHTVANAIRQREGDLVNLRAQGASRWLVVAYLLAESAIVGLIGTGLGVAAGIGFATVGVGLFRDSVSSMYAPIPPPTLAFTGGELMIVALCGMGAVFLGAVVPCVACIRLRPLPRLADGAGRGSSVGFTVAGLAGVALALLAAASYRAWGLADRVTAVSGLVGLIFLASTLLVPGFLTAVTPLVEGVLKAIWGLLGTWTWQQVRKRRYHTATTIGSLAAGVAFTVSMAILLGSYRGAFSDWVTQMFSGDVFVNAGSTISLLSGPTIERSLVGEIAKAEGVSRVMPWRLIEVQFRGNPIIVQGMSERLIDRIHSTLHLDHRAGEVVISDTLAERYHLKVGDEIELPAPKAPLRLRVGAVAADYVLDLGNVKVGWELFERHFGAQGANVIVVDAASGVSSTDLKHRIETLAAGRYDILALTGGELRDLVDSLINQSFALTYLLELLAAFVTVLAMVNATSAAIIDRSRDLNTWRALGLQRRYLVRLLATEAAALGGLSSLIGLAAGAVIGATLVVVVAPSVTGFRMHLLWPFGAMSGLIVLSTASAGVAAYLVGRSQTHRIIAPAEAA